MTLINVEVDLPDGDVIGWRVVMAPVFQRDDWHRKVFFGSIAKALQQAAREPKGRRFLPPWLRNGAGVG